MTTEKKKTKYGLLLPHFGVHAVGARGLVDLA